MAMQDDNDRHQKQETAAGGHRPAGPRHSTDVVQEEGQAPLLTEEGEAPRMPLASPENSYHLLGSPFARGSPLDGGSVAGSPGYSDCAGGSLATVPDTAAGAGEEAAVGAETGAAASGTAAGTENGAAAVGPMTSGFCQNRSDGLTTTTLVLSVLPILCLPSDAAGEVVHLFENMVAQVAAATAGRRAALEAAAGEQQRAAAGVAGGGHQPDPQPWPPPVGGSDVEDLGAPHGGRSLPGSLQPPG